MPSRGARLLDDGARRRSTIRARAGRVLSLALFLVAPHWCFAVQLGAQGPGGLPSAVFEALRAAGVATTGVGLVVRPLDGTGAGFEYQAGQALNPASTMKLVTTYAALGVLGPQYRWRTTVHAGGAVVGDRLRGDLILRGGGDPKLVVEDLTALVARLRSDGLRVIEGDLVLDDGFYQDDPEEAASDAREFDSTQPWAVRPSAVLLNFRAVGVIASPIEAQDNARITLDPPLGGVALSGRVAVRPGPCREAPQFDARWLSDGEQLRVAGRSALGCGELSTWIAAPNAERYAKALFSAVWSASGGVWQGSARTVAGAAVGRPVLLEWWSPRTLIEVVRDANKFSNNVMTRQVLLQLGAERAGPPGTTRKGVRVVADWLAQRGLALPELVLENGSGLSRKERISADSLARLLSLAAADPALGTEFRESLPLVGVDGTMKRRLQGEPISGQAWIKTGSANEVRAMAGYVHASSGRRWVVVMLVNGAGAQAASAAQDRLLRWVHGQL